MSDETVATLVVLIPALIAGVAYYERRHARLAERIEKLELWAKTQNGKFWSGK